MAPTILVVSIAIILFFAFMVYRVKSKNVETNEQNIVHYFLSHNGSLDFYINTDHQFVSCASNKIFEIQDIKKITAIADHEVLFEKNATSVQFDDLQLSSKFDDFVKFVSYEIELKNGEVFESVVDVASNKGSRQREQLKQTFLKITDIFNKLKIA